MSIKCCSISRKSMPAKDLQVWICTFSTALFCKDAIGVVRISFCRTRSAVLTTMKMSLDAIKPALSLRRVRRAAELSLRSHCEALVATADRHVVHCKRHQFSANKSRNVKEHIIMEGAWLCY